MHRGEEPLEGLHVNLKPDRCQASTERKYALGPAIEAGPFLFRRGGGLNKARHQKRESSRTTAQPSGSAKHYLQIAHTRQGGATPDRPEMRTAVYYN